MSSSSTALQVLIVGAGPGGLVLAQGLRQEGIEVSVHERTRAHVAHPDGFRFRVRQRGIEALRESLPPRLYQQFRATLAQAPDGQIEVDEQLQRKPVQKESYGDLIQDLSLSRLTLQRILQQDLADVLHTGQAFQRYELLPGGRVRAFFDDGSWRDADVLVGADGAGSTVRRQLVPQARRVDTGILSFRGKVELDAQSRTRIDPVLLDKTHSIRGHSPVRLFVTRHENRPEAAEAIRALNAASAARHPAGLLYDNTRSYVMWTVFARRGDYPPHLQAPDAAGPDVLAFVRAATRDWHPSIGALLALTDPDTIGSAPMKTALPFEPWPTSQVTLLGDAIHSVITAGGQGANAAMADANLLRRHLRGVPPGAASVLRALRAYEAEMQPVALQTIRNSIAGHELNFGPIDTSVSA